VFILKEVVGDFIGRDFERLFASVRIRFGEEMAEAVQTFCPEGFFANP
jgi:hypothetical protein